MSVFKWVKGKLKVESGGGLAGIADVTAASELVTLDPQVLAAINALAAAVATQVTLLALKNRADLLGTEATLAARGTEATLVTRATETTLANLKTRADLLGTEATLTAFKNAAATETTLAAVKARADLLATEATLASRATEATAGNILTRANLLATEATLNTLKNAAATELTLAAIKARADLLGTEATLAALKTRADLLATEGTLGNLLTRANLLATEATLAALKARGDLLGTEATLGNILTRANLLGTETTLAALKTRADLLGTEVTAAAAKAVLDTIKAVLDTVFTRLGDGNQLAKVGRVITVTPAPLGVDGQKDYPALDQYFRTLINRGPRDGFMSPWQTRIAKVGSISTALTTAVDITNATAVPTNAAPQDSLYTVPAGKKFRLFGVRIMQLTKAGTDGAIGVLKVNGAIAFSVTSLGGSTTLTFEIPREFAAGDVLTIGLGVSGGTIASSLAYEGIEVPA